MTVATPSGGAPSGMAAEELGALSTDIS